nr:MAG TPA: hypothetical protein [Caudoviricetes sp.]
MTAKIQKRVSIRVSCVTIFSTKLIQKTIKHHPNY